MNRLQSLAMSVSRASPAPFFIGFVTGILVLTALGHLVAAHLTFEHFQRLHRYLNSETLFYPTASEVVAIANANTTPDQIAVVVGGSSVMNGEAQGQAEVWTDELARLLGDRFAVLNFAVPGGAPEEHGFIAAQALVKEGRQVIYLADTRAGYMGPPDGVANSYIFWDALYKGLLYGPTEQRVQRIAENAQSPKLAAQEDELQWRERLDSVLYFTDLWTGVGYQYAFLTWNYLVDASIGPFTMPRRLVPDPYPGIMQHLPVADRISPTQMEAELRIVGSFASLTCVQDNNGTWREDPSVERWPEFQADLAASFPVELRQRTLILLTYYDPLVVDRLETSVRSCYERSLELTSDDLNAAGYHAAVVGRDYTPDDFADRVHLTGGGGRKLAADVAPLVRETARTLGYLP
jgi:hypothetical protein